MTKDNDCKHELAPFDCFECLSETYYKNDRRGEKHGNDIELIRVFYCLNCKQNVYQSIFIKYEEEFGIYISMSTERSRNDETIKLHAKLPKEPIRKLNDDCTNYLEHVIQLKPSVSEVCEN